MSVGDDVSQLRRSGIFVETTRHTNVSSPVGGHVPSDVAPTELEGSLGSGTIKMSPRWGWTVLLSRGPKFTGGRLDRIAAILRSCRCL